MNRVLKSYDLSSLQEAQRLIPEALMRRVERADLCLGVDPVFAGIHTYENAPDGRSFKETGHVVYGWGIQRPASERNTTMFMPIQKRTYSFIHEYGHILHESIGMENIGINWVTDYAKVNYREAFAETFTTWILKDQWHPTWRDWFRHWGGKFEAKMLELQDLG